MKFIKENFDRSADLERRITDYKLKHLNESIKEPEKEIIEEEKKVKLFEIKYEQAGTTKIDSNIEAKDIPDAMEKFASKHLEDVEPVKKIISCDSVEYVLYENVKQDLKVSEDKAKVQLQGLVDQARKVLGEVGDGLKSDITAAGFTVDNSGKVVKAVTEDIEKLPNGKWANVGKDGKTDSGKFKTKKEADAQRKAMFANGYKGESLEEKIEESLYPEYVSYQGKKMRVQGIRPDGKYALSEPKYSGLDITNNPEYLIAASKEEVEPLEEKTEECLTEDVEIEIETKDEPKVEVEDSDEHSIKNVPEMPTTDCKMVVANILNPLIKDELEAIDGYNSAVATFRGMLEDETTDKSIDYKGIIAVISEITNEENLHIGQLEKLLETVSPNAKSIDDGKEEAAGQLEETSEEEVKKEKTVEQVEDKEDKE